MDNFEAAWDRWQPLPSQFSGEVPTASALIGANSLEPWLEARYSELASSGYIMEAAAAVGLLVRLWVPTGTQMAGATPPSGPAARWAEGLPSRELDALERFALERSGRLQEELYELPGMGADPTPQDVRRMAYDRDALECVLTVLRLAGRGTMLAPELGHCDDAAITVASALPITPGLENDPLLRAVGRKRPFAWWAFEVDFGYVGTRRTPGPYWR